MFSKNQLKIEILKSLIKGLIPVIVVSVAVYILSGQIAKISDDITQNRTAIAILESKGRVAEELRNNFVAIGDGDKKVEEAFIEAGDIVKFINAVEFIAKENKLEQVLRFSTPTPVIASEKQNENAEALNLTISDYRTDINASMASFNEYLKQLEKIPYFSTIKSISIISPSSTNWDKNISAVIEAKLYLKQ